MVVIEREHEVLAGIEESPEALFPEAKKRRRRRRWLIVMGIVTLMVLGALATYTATMATSHTSPRPTPKVPARTLVLPKTGEVPLVAWSDYYGQLHVGDLGGLKQHVVARTDADPTASLVAVGQSVFWVRSRQPTKYQTVETLPNPTVQRFDLTTGRTSSVGPGTQVFASMDGSFVFVGTRSGQLGRLAHPGSLDTE